MPSTNTSTPSPEIKSRTSAHEPFSWFSDEAKNYPLANFVGLTMDVCNGVNQCLEIINSSDLDRQAAEDGNDVTPAISPMEASNLLRMAMATSRLMSYEAERTIRWINEYGAAKLKAESKALERKESDAPRK